MNNRQGWTVFLPSGDGRTFRRAHFGYNADCPDPEGAKRTARARALAWIGNPVPKDIVILHVVYDLEGKHGRITEGDSYEC